jgi:hypothetical protein
LWVKAWSRRTQLVASAVGRADFCTHCSSWRCRDRGRSVTVNKSSVGRKWREGGRHKPGSVPPLPEGRLSIWDACCQAPLAVRNSGAGKRPTLPLDLAPDRGLPSQHLSMLLVRSYRTLAPLPVPLEKFLKPSAVCFCGTLLTVARTGRYPAGLVFREPGLSSDWRSPIRNHLRYLPLVTSLSPRVETLR